MFLLTGCGNSIEKVEDKSNAFNLDKPSQETIETLSTYRGVSLTTMKGSLDKSMKEEYIRTTLTPIDIDQKILKFYVKEFKNEEGKCLLILDNRPYDLLQTFKYYKIDCILEPRGQVKFNGETMNFYRLVNFRFLDKAGNTINSLEEDVIYEQASKDKFELGEGKHKEILSICEVTEYGIKAVNEYGMMRNLDYDESVEIYMLEVGNSYEIEYESTYDEFFDEYDNILTSTPVKTEKLKINVNKYIESEETTNGVSLSEMTGSLKDSLTEGNNKLTLNSYDLYSFFDEYEIQSGDYTFRTHASVGELLEEVYDYYPGLVIVVNSDNEIINARILDANGNMLPSIQEEDIYKKLDKEGILHIEDMRDTFTVIDYGYSYVYAKSLKGTEIQFEYGPDFPKYKMKENITYTFEYQIVQRQSNGNEKEYILKNAKIIQ